MKLQNVTNSLEFVKKEFQTVFRNNPHELYSKNPNFFNGQEYNGLIIQKWEDLRDLTLIPEYWSAPLFNLVKVL